MYTVEKPKDEIYCYDFNKLTFRLTIECIAKNEKELIRGALLHDYFLYDWHIKGNRPKGLHGYTHPTTAYRNASKRINLTPIESDIIMKHMFPLTPIPPKFFESYVVCLVDKVCSTCETLKLDSLFNKYPRLKS